MSCSIRAIRTGVAFTLIALLAVIAIIANITTVAIKGSNLREARQYLNTVFHRVAFPERSTVPCVPLDGGQNLSY